MMRFRREPKWDLPLATERLIRSPLRRPFEGRGSELRLAVRDDLGSQAMSVRQVRTAVRESAIMRWLGGLGATAFGDFRALGGRGESIPHRAVRGAATGRGGVRRDSQKRKRPPNDRRPYIMWRWIPSGLPSSLPLELSVLPDNGWPKCPTLGLPLN